MLKEVYGIGLKNALNNTSVILQEIQRRSDKIDFEGKKAVWNIHTSRSASTGSRREFGKVPAPDRQRFTRAEETTRTIIHTIKLSREVIESTRSNTGAFARAMETEMRGAENDLRNDLGRQIYGQGRVQTDSTTTVRTGVIANVNGAPAANVITLDNLDGGAVVPTSKGEMRYFFVGMLLDAINPANGARTSIAGGMEVTAVDAAAKTITVSDATGVLDNNWIVRQGSYDNEITGLRVLINNVEGDKYDGTNVASVHGLRSSQVPSWASTVSGGSTTAINEAIFETTGDTINTDGSGANPSLYVGSHEQRTELARQLQTQKRYDGRQTTLTAGWTGLQIARGTYVADRYAPSNDIFVIDPSELLWFSLADFQWDQEDGKVLFKTPDELAYEARYFGMFALGTATRGSHGRIKLQAVPA